MKTGPKKVSAEQELKILRSKVKRLESKKSVNGISGRSSGYIAKCCISMMCKFMKREEDHCHRSYNDITMNEFRIFCMEIIQKENPNTAL